MTIQASLPLPGLVSSLVSQQVTSSSQREMVASPEASVAANKDAGMTEAERLQAIEAKKAAFKEFEGIFVSMLIKEMRKGTELFAGDSTDSLGVLFDQHIGKAIGEGGGIGIAQQLSRYVEAQKL